MRDTVNVEVKIRLDVCLEVVSSRWRCWLVVDRGVYIPEDSTGKKRDRSWEMVAT